MYKVSKKVRKIFNAMKKCFSIAPALMLFIFIKAVISFCKPFILLYLTKTGIDMLTDGTMYEFVYAVVGLSLCVVLCDFILELAQNQIQNRSALIQNEMQQELNEARMTISYEKMICQDTSQLLSRIRAITNTPVPCNVALFDAVVGLIVTVVGLSFYASEIGKLNIIVCIGIIVLYLVTYLFNIRLIQKTKSIRDIIHPLQMKIAYLVTRCDDFTFAKDIRLFNMTDWLFSKSSDIEREKVAVENRREIDILKNHIINATIALLRDAGIYIWLIASFLSGGFEIDDFVYYSGLTTLLSSQLTTVIGRMQDCYSGYLNVCDYTEFQNTLGSAAEQDYQVLPKTIHTIELDNVSYRYPGSERDILKGVNLKINDNEKIGIVGENGAGKSTLVLLICGLLTPSGGSIRVNGVDISRFDPKKYPQLYSAVFQQISVLPMSIADNIELDQRDPTKMEQAMKLAEMDDISTDTLLIPEINPTARRLSGGEMQKLALARAIYKDASAVILDEPTAALDPIAESNVYQNYNRMLGGKIGIFISHRLASTLFCDRILLLDGGNIAEEGTHDELLELGGKYKEMYELQRKYYLKVERGNECL